MTLEDKFDRFKIVNREENFLKKNMKFITIIHIIISVFLIVSILLQNRGSGLGSTFGGDFGGYYTKRGLEKFLFYTSIFFGFCFIVVAIASIILAGK